MEHRPGERVLRDLAVVIELFSRQVVGWSLREDMTRDIAVDALCMAWFKRQPGKHAGLIFHSDRGSQYASQDFRDALKEYGITASMSRRGNCWDLRLQRDAVRLVEGRAAAWAEVRNQAPGQGRSHRLAALVQPNPTALDAGLRQPDAVRARLAHGPGRTGRQLMISAMGYGIRGQGHIAPLGLPKRSV